MSGPSWIDDFLEQVDHFLARADAHKNPGQRDALIQAINRRLQEGLPVTMRDELLTRREALEKIQRPRPPLGTSTFRRS
jgi:hypothetical protein